MTEQAFLAIAIFLLHTCRLKYIHVHTYTRFYVYMKYKHFTYTQNSIIRMYCNYIRCFLKCIVLNAHIDYVIKNMYNIHFLLLYS